MCAVCIKNNMPHHPSYLHIVLKYIEGGGGEREGARDREREREREVQLPYFFHTYSNKSKLTVYR